MRPKKELLVKVNLAGMDYENFRQMVLGANLKPMKNKEMLDMTSKKPKSQFTLFTSTEQKTSIPCLETNKSSEKIPSTFREIKKQVILFEEMSLDEKKQKSTNLLLMISNANFDEIISYDFDFTYFTKLCELILSNNSIEDIKILISILNKVGESKNFIKLQTLPKHTC